MAKEQPALRFAGGVEKKAPPAKPRKPAKIRSFAEHGYSQELVQLVSNYAAQHMALEIKSGYYFLQNLNKWGLTERQITFMLKAHMEDPRAAEMGLVQLCSKFIEAKKAARAEMQQRIDTNDDLIF